VIDGPEEDIDLSPDQATGLFRIFQETLTNISKHAGASRVDVRLAVDQDSITLEVVDNGRGLGATDRKKPKSFGIRGMVERANALGGVLTVSDPGQGCRVSVRLPLASASRDNHAVQAHA
jgi:two-component system, NarL family, sensor histidine kinase UhpB